LNSCGGNDCSGNYYIVRLPFGAIKKARYSAATEKRAIKKRYFQSYIMNNNSISEWEIYDEFMAFGFFFTSSPFLQSNAKKTLVNLKIIYLFSHSLDFVKHLF